MACTGIRRSGRSTRRTLTPLRPALRSRYSVRRLRDTHGDDLGGYRYTAFGEEYPADADTPAASVTQPLQWKGRWASTLAGGVYDIRARQWSPGIGAYTAIDGFKFRHKATTLWGWPHQNPSRFRDRTGHDDGPNDGGAPPGGPPGPPPPEGPNGPQCDPSSQCCPPPSGGGSGGGGGGRGGGDDGDGPGPGDPGPNRCNCICNDTNGSHWDAKDYWDCQKLCKPSSGYCK